MLLLGGGGGGEIGGGEKLEFNSPLLTELDAHETRSFVRLVDLQWEPGVHSLVCTC